MTVASGAHGDMECWRGYMEEGVVLSGGLRFALALRLMNRSSRTTRLSGASGTAVGGFGKEVAIRLRYDP